jgi:hypothetical protein
MRRTRLFYLLMALVMLAWVASTAWAQNYTDPKADYLDYAGENQSRNIPAGSVNDPGSHLTFLVDTGLNLRERIAPDPGVANAVQALGLQTDAQGFATAGQWYSNFISVVNTHPTQAVTLHIRYYNDNCQDILDFLVVLTCNDTLMFDPFNYNIPFTSENTRNRFLYSALGPSGAKAPGSSLPPINASEWGSGRFLITVAASGASTDTDDDAEILFPYEARNIDKCNMNYQTSLDANATLEETVAGIAPNVGISPSVSANNLHVYDALQISFNFLVGMQTVAVPKAFIPGSSTDQFLAYGLNAWARPVINRSNDYDTDLSPITGYPDGDGPNNVLIGKVVLGSEYGYDSHQGNSSFTVGTIAPNGYYLRNDVHGGDIRPVPDSPGSYSEFGALGTSAFHAGLDPANAVMHFISVVDDFNGSNNKGCDPNLNVQCDRSANVGAAYTTYVMQIYDHAEHLLFYTQPPPPPISPLPGCEGPECEVTLKLTCYCLRAFLTDLPSATTNVDDLTIQDLVDFYGPAITQGCTAVGSTCNPLFEGLLKGMGVGNDVSGGWIRFVRDNTVTGNVTESVGLAAGLGGAVVAYDDGTSSIRPSGTESDYNNTYDGASFLTVGQQLAKFGGLGAGWWLNSAASCPLVSFYGDEEQCKIDNPTPTD